MATDPDVAVADAAFADIAPADAALAEMVTRLITLPNLNQESYR